MHTIRFFLRGSIIEIYSESSSRLKQLGAIAVEDIPASFKNIHICFFLFIYMGKLSNLNKKRTKKNRIFSIFSEPWIKRYI